MNFQNMKIDVLTKTADSGAYILTWLNFAWLIILYFHDI